MANKALGKQNYYFPENFHFGVSTSAFQIEGAWNEDGKGESVWDKGMHGYPQFVFDGANGDIACDSYHQYQEDVQMIKNLKLNVYRFSISWSRILPNGKINYINQKGIDYYNQLIDELLKNGIIPYVTMYHWDLPQPLQDEGGWTNSKIIDYFVDYARILFQKFGDRVKHWITINEIKQFCTRGYGISSMPIFRTDPPITQKSVKAGYEAAHHGLLAHAKTYRLYQKDFKKTQMGLIGLSGDCEWVDPSDPTNKEDIEASITALEISNGWIFNPLIHGNYPAIMIERIKNNSLEEGFAQSRLPEFTVEEQDLLKGSLDFLGINHFATLSCHSDYNHAYRPSYNFDFGIGEYFDSLPKSGPLFEPVPSGLTKLLVWLKSHYGDIPIIITENGCADDGKIQDVERAEYLKNFLYAVLKAIHEEKCNVKGYIVWSLMDNVEWMLGYTARFGLYSVDFEKPERPRTRKLSSYVFADIVTKKCINWDYTL